MISPVSNINCITYKNTITKSDNSAKNFFVPNSKNTYELETVAKINKMTINFSGMRRYQNIIYPNHNEDKYVGCMIGAAIGDALGTPIKGLMPDERREKFGKKGITDFVITDGKAQISENTQLCMFTADGLIKSSLRNGDDDLPDFRNIYNSYQDWRNARKLYYEPNNHGWVSNIREFYKKNNQEFVCTEVIDLGIPGSIEFPVNENKDSEGLMRTAPFGLRLYKDPDLAFEAGARCASLTHGSPDAYLSAGLISAIISNIIIGKDLDYAVDDSIEILKKYKGHDNLLELIDKARQLSKSKLAEKAAIRKIGAGNDAHEACAIGLYCVFKHPDDFEKAVIAAANHEGNTSVTSIITGCIVGTNVGEKNIPLKWRENIAFSSEIKELAMDLFSDIQDIKDADERYPNLIKLNKYNFAF